MCFEWYLHFYWFVHVCLCVVVFFFFFFCAFSVLYFVWNARPRVGTHCKIVIRFVFHLFSKVHLQWIWNDYRSICNEKLRHDNAFLYDNFLSLVLLLLPFLYCCCTSSSDICFSSFCLVLLGATIQLRECASACIVPKLPQYGQNRHRNGEIEREWRTTRNHFIEFDLLCFALISFLVKSNRSWMQLSAPNGGIALNDLSLGKCDCDNVDDLMFREIVFNDGSRWTRFLNAHFMCARPPVFLSICRCTYFTVCVCLSLSLLFFIPFSTRVQHKHRKKIKSSVCGVWNELCCLHCIQ